MSALSRVPLGFLVTLGHRILFALHGIIQCFRTPICLRFIGYQLLV
jgi:hypothetical protein